MMTTRARADPHLCLCTAVTPSAAHATAKLEDYNSARVWTRLETFGPVCTRLGLRAGYAHQAYCHACACGRWKAFGERADSHARMGRLRTRAGAPDAGVRCVALLCLDGCRRVMDALAGARGKDRGAGGEKFR
jgi:hypothetical protein